MTNVDRQINRQDKESLRMWRKSFAGIIETSKGVDVRKFLDILHSASQKISKRESIPRDNYAFAVKGEHIPRGNYSFAVKREHVPRDHIAFAVSLDIASRVRNSLLMYKNWSL